VRQGRDAKADTFKGVSREQMRPRTVRCATPKWKRKLERSDQQSRESRDW
jgi:hypothetical protein